LSNARIQNFKQMKKIIVLVIAAFALSTSFAQKGQQNNKEQFSKFFDEKVKPEVEKQQKEFFSVLTKDEKKELKLISQQADDLFARVSENKSQENRMEIHGEMMKLRDKAEIIAKAHPEQSEKYKNAMIENLEKWKSEMPARNKSSMGKGNGNGKGMGKGQGMGNGQGKGQGQGRGQGRGNGDCNGHQKGMNAQRGGGNQIAMHFTDPAWLLLWSADRKPMMMMAGQRGGMGMQNPVMNNPELREELKVYTENNILPQIIESRKLFDEKLSSEEKSQIVEARGKITTRDAMQKAYRESEDFEPGARRDDPAFDAFRKGMQKSMKEVRMISMMHATEIAELRNSMKPQYDKWLNDIEVIFSKYDDNKYIAGEMLSKSFKQNTSPMAFILFDSANADFWTKKRGHGMGGNGMNGNGMQGMNGRGNCF